MQDETVDEIRENVKRIATKHLEKGDATGWFEELYKHADGDIDQIPWADLEPNKYLQKWAKSTDLKGVGRSALVIGCGLGDDAKFLLDLGFKVAAFDVSEKAIQWAKKIHSETDIEFRAADLFDPPKDWSKAFDFVLEVYTIQALPLNMREKTIDAISQFVSEDGELIVIQRARENGEEPESLPWALSPNDLSRFETNGLRQIARHEYPGEEEEPITRFVVEYKR